MGKNRANIHKLKTLLNAILFILKIVTKILIYSANIEIGN